MIAAVDVHYRGLNIAKAAGVVFIDFADTEPLCSYTSVVNEICEYVPGFFYLREMPCLLALLDTIKEDIHTLIIDGYVSLGKKPGLGFHLWKRLGSRVKVIGVAKTFYHGSDGIKLFRGTSKNPLYITSAGIETEAAAELIGKMYGNSRIPLLLKIADTLSRQW